MEQRSSSSEFVARYGAAAFAYRDELLALVAAGTPVERGGAVPRDTLRGIYARRVRHIERLVAERGAALDPALGVDVLEGCRALVTALEEPDAPADVRLWLAEAPGGIGFALFTDEGTGRVLACIRGHDQRVRADEHGLE